MDDTLIKLWEDMLQRLSKSVAEPIFEQYFMGSLIPLSYDGKKLVLDSPASFIAAFIKRRYTGLLEDAAKAVTGRDTEIVILYSEDGGGADDTSKSAETETVYVAKPEPPVQEEEIAQSVEDDTWEQETFTGMDEAPQELPKVKEAVAAVAKGPEAEMPHLDPSYTFENFITGNSNRLAYAKALAVADSPGRKEFNPLYIYGGSGLGKTHLMHAIGHRILKTYPEMRIRCITSEDFVNEYIQSLSDRSTEGFRKRYRNIDVLLVDDIQFLGDGNKKSSKEEFFHTFNKLQQDRKQIVLTSDRAPQDIKSMEARLRSRFQSGSVAIIDPPDLETRTAILKAWAERRHIDFDLDAINYIASNASENIRELNGAFNNVVISASAEHSRVTLPLTRQAISYLTATKEEKKYITIDEITKFICQYYNVPYKELMGKKKTKDIAMPRQIAMYLCRSLTENTYPHIGTAFNGRDHTTVMHAYQKVAKMMEKDERFKEKIEELEQKICGVDN